MRRRHDLPFDDCVSQEPNRPASKAGRRLAAGERDQLGLLLAIEDRRNRRRFALLAGQHRVKPLLHQLCPDALDHGDVGVECLADRLVRPALTSYALVGLEQDAGLQNGLGRSLAFRDQIVQSLSLVRVEPHQEFLVGHGLPPCRMTPTGQESVFARKCNRPPTRRFSWVEPLGQTRNIPIVFVSISDPIGEGFIASFAHPGGNVTGFTNFESSMTGKWVELLKHIAPEITRVGFLFNPQATAGGGSYFLRPIDNAASAFKVKAVMALVHDDDEIEATFAALAREPGAGAVLLPDIFTTAHHLLVVTLAERYRVPTVYSYRFMAERGGLVSYGVDVDNLFERAATYVDRILNGAKPTDLPVQAPTKFELAVNQKTAKALGLTIPPMLLAIADKVIE